MSIVTCTIDEIELEGDYVDEVPGICASCTRCGNCAEVYGTSGASVRAALVQLRESCPRNEANFYQADDGSDEA